MKVIVSACLAGDNCKYNGGNNLNQKMMDFRKRNNGHEWWYEYDRKQPVCNRTY